MNDELLELVMLIWLCPPLIQGVIRIMVSYERDLLHALIFVWTYVWTKKVYDVVDL